MLGLDESSADNGYYAMIRKTATVLARDNQRLSVSSGDAVELTTQITLIEDFLKDVDDNASALDLAQMFAIAWKKYKQTA